MFINRNDPFVVDDRASKNLQLFLIFCLHFVYVFHLQFSFTVNRTKYAAHHLRFRHEDDDDDDGDLEILFHTKNYFTCKIDFS